MWIIRGMALAGALFLVDFIPDSKAGEDSKQPAGASPLVLAERRRVWTNQGADDNSIHAMRNGRLVVLSAGPDISCLFGPPYTSPNLLQLSTTSLRLELIRK